MSENPYKFKTRATKRFIKHAKLVKKRSEKDSEKLKNTIELLAKGEKLPERFRDHELTGNLKGNRECHILPDLLLIYRIFNDILILELLDTGTHSDLFSL
ncbi:mRNA interferase YafQ [Treponema berlinense]|uniref:mRNA interferase YafQ n=1 Tax=Treponema berlinense TaxID=225004 RepID=A0A1T4QJE4_9SPIR|nr:type II toxin-antitoxin system YafQ family toxin [Treponema berlinense]SKA03631.1 mRNA interferase YafQ [Treponema berlinense]